jgi:hypothetical protein
MGNSPCEGEGFSSLGFGVFTHAPWVVIVRFWLLCNCNIRALNFIEVQKIPLHSCIMFEGFLQAHVSYYLDLSPCGGARTHYQPFMDFLICKILFNRSH